MFSKTCMLTAFLLIPMTCVAQKAVTETAKPATAKPGASTPAKVSLPDMEASFGGQPVVAVGPVFRHTSLNDPPEGTLLQQLQALTEKLPDENGVAFIPFKIRGTWTIAPEVRQEVNPHVSSLTPEDAAGRSLVLNEMLLSLSPELMKAIGSEQGVPFPQLPRGVQAALMRTIVPPLEIQQHVPHEWDSPTGEKMSGTHIENKGRIEGPLNWESVRVRANLTMQHASVMIGERYSSYVSLRQDMNRVELMPGATDRSWRNTEMDLKAFLEVPNTFKPSDLEGRHLAMAFGTSGSMTLRSALDQVTRITRLRFYLPDTQKEIPVFVGAASIPVGDVLDSIRLALTGAWRKIGDGYVLAWDKRGLAAIQQSLHEQTAVVRKSLSERSQDMISKPGWLDLVEFLPFAANDDLALTAAQRRALAEKPLQENQGGIPFRDLTPKQQDALRKNMIGQTIHVWNPDNPGPGSSRAVDETDIQRTTLGVDMRVQLGLLIPGQGWLDVSRTLNFGTINPYMLLQARRKETGQEAEEMLPPEAKEFLANPKPISLPASIRAVAVPPLGAARLNLLAEEMKRRGMNMLFYPVLFGGYATFPSKYFPLHPALRESDGWADAIKAMEPAGIRVVGVIGMLDWQHLGNNAHWLTRHKDWMDVDPLGRTRLEWFTQNTSAASNPLIAGLLPSNIVRASEPQVASRLKAFLTEFAGRKDGVGVALTGWSSGSSVVEIFGEDSAPPPPLGFSIAERVEGVMRSGRDPLDDALYAGLFSPRGWDSGVRQKEDNVVSSSVTLAKTLLEDAKKLRPDWTTYLVHDSVGPEFRGTSNTGDLRPDVTISNVFMTGGEGARPGTGLLLPATHKNFFQLLLETNPRSMEGERFPAALKTMNSIALFHMIMTTEGRAFPGQVPLAVYDFRAGADLITPGMAWIAPPNPTAAPTTALPANPTREPVGKD